jgi:hypothetical protein
MSNVLVLRNRLISITVLALLLLASTIHAQTTTFDYQGRLLDAGTPANGSYDLQFALFGLLSGGSQIGSTQTRTSVAVSSGVFTVQLDFGLSAFPGADRFLEISVRAHSADPNTPAYTLLAPRQQINATPYAIRTLSAATADSSTNATQLGGVAASQYVQTNDSRLTDARPPVAGSSNYIQNATVQQTGASFNIDGNGTIGGDLIANGQVGIGTVTPPTEKLQVAGIVQSTTGGFKFPDGTLQTTAVAASPINQVVRGVITFTGTNYEVSQSFSPHVDPSKSVVLLSENVLQPGGSGPIQQIVAPCLVSLSTGSITVALNYNGGVGGPTQRVSFQIIEYK